MTILTLISRVSDGLMLSEEMESDRNSDLEAFRAQAKKILKTISRKSPPKLTIDNDGDGHYFAYIIANDVCYLTLCEKSYPKRLAFNFLGELQKEFDIQHGVEIESAKRPYAFIKFDTFIQKTKKVYSDTRSQRNLNKVTEDLFDVQRIMNKNISEILGRGEKIDSVSKKSNDLLSGSEKYKHTAKQLNTSLFFRKYGIVTLAVALVFLVIYIKFFY